MNVARDGQRPGGAAGRLRPRLGFCSCPRERSTAARKSCRPRRARGRRRSRRMRPRSSPPSWPAGRPRARRGWTSSSRGRSSTRGPDATSASRSGRGRARSRSSSSGAAASSGSETSPPSGTSATCGTFAALTGCSSSTRCRPGRTTWHRAGRWGSQEVVDLLVESAQAPVEVVVRSGAPAAQRDQGRVGRPLEDRGRDRLAGRDPAPADARRCLGLCSRRRLRKGCEVMSSKPRALITGVTGQDGSYLAEFLLERGYEVFGMVRRASTESGERIAHLVDRITLVQADLLDPASLTSRARGIRVPPRCTTSPPRASCRRPGTSPCSRPSSPAVGVTRVLEAIRRVDPDDPLLPGVVLGDVRQGARGSAERAHALLPALAVRSGEGVRPLHHGQLPRVVRAVRGLGDPVQPRVAAPRARVRDAQDHGRRGSHQARPGRRAAARQPRRRARLGLRRRLRARDVADAPAGGRTATT